MILIDPEDESKRGPGGKLAFCTLWATGPDTTLDGIFRVQALRKKADGSWERFDQHCKPFDEDDATATARMQREYGVSAEELRGAPHAREIWGELDVFLQDRTVIVLDAPAFNSWFAHEAGAEAALPETLGLLELAALLFPGRLANRGDKLIQALVDIPKPGMPLATGPEELQAAMRELLQRFLTGDELALAIAALGYGSALREFRATDPPAARVLERVLELLDSPDAWRDDAAGALPLNAPIDSIAMARALELSSSAAELIDELEPRCAEEGRRWEKVKPLSPHDEDVKPLDDAQVKLLDDIFEVHLPALSQPDGAISYRDSQHSVSQQVASTLGGGELLLVHAPTGTGKTLAYLIPTMLWAMKNDLRVGIATYTRALQEQAAEREVPLALAALARSGAGADCRVAVLKGRENYLCWKALRLHVPSDDDDGEQWLAWTSVVLFALNDLEGDLDRVPLRAPIRMEQVGNYAKRLARLVSQVRARTGCCSTKKDRSTCAAEIARRRAERSHVVITNHAFALSRQQFFKHLVFDECEHLHDQAHSAWSHSLTLRRIHTVLERLHKPRSLRPNASLDRLAKKLAIGTKSQYALEEALDAWQISDLALVGLEAQVKNYAHWRNKSNRGRNDKDGHSLFREFVESDEGAHLVQARKRFQGGLNQLEVALAVLEERIEASALRGAARIRYGIERSRTKLQECLVSIDAWLPLAEGVPEFLPRTFYDVEENGRGEHVLAARVLLPNEYLGRNYLPQLDSGALLSATTWVGGSFDASAGYLGLDRAEAPAEKEQRDPTTVRRFRSPDLFDYSRVLVCAPRDAPSPSMDKQAHLRYVREFICHLAERTRGRMLVLFTNAEDTRRMGESLAGFFRARRIPLWYQNMPGTGKEELAELFRSRVDSVLLGVDTFWYGADFPGETLEYLVIARLPFGVPDRYHHAQSAALGIGQHRKQIYMPRALAKLRQGFGRLMRSETDKGCVFLLDGRVTQPRQRVFLNELPLRNEFAGPDDEDQDKLAQLVRLDTNGCIQRSLAHMGMLSDVKRRGLDLGFGPDEPTPPVRTPEPERIILPTPPPLPEPPPVIDISSEDLPF